MAAVMDLAEFLLARIAEDEDQARTFLADNHAALARTDAPFRKSAMSLLARALAECDAKRRIVEAATSPVQVDPGPDYAGSWSQGSVQGRFDGLAEAMAYLALPYADHPDYRSEWRP